MKTSWATRYVMSTRFWETSTKMSLKEVCETSPFAPSFLFLVERNLIAKPFYTFIKFSKTFTIRIEYFQSLYCFTVLDDLNRYERMSNNSDDIFRLTVFLVTSMLLYKQEMVYSPSYWRVITALWYIVKRLRWPVFAPAPSMRFRTASMWPVVTYGRNVSKPGFNQ